MRLSLGLGLVLGLLAGPVVAEPAECPALAFTFEELTGYLVTAPPAGLDGGWCVFDRAVMTAEGLHDLSVERLRLRGEVAEGKLVELALQASGVRLSPALREVDPVLRETLRLQSVEVAGVLRSGAEGVTLRDGRVKLSGGMDLAVEADLAGGGLSGASVLTASVTGLRLRWRNDGRILRPAMEAAGARIEAESSGPAAVDVARAALLDLAGALPLQSLVGETADALEDLVRDLPQGRGQLTVELTSDGIGAAQLGLLALSDSPAGPDALARFLAGTAVSIDWQPGIAP
jgi:hypothetical protein